MRQWAAPLRFAVFVEEQKVPAEMEIDDWDPKCVHAVAFDADSKPVGTGRLLPDGHIGRMAVAAPARASGVGSALLKRLMEEARRRGHRNAVLSAQTHAVPFYARHGYTPISGEYLDCGIPHVDMRCAL
ncbi:MAG TPA: GNAT family N-acetyltransferase [Burkholderiaceae bacterium]|nr:GNAT family N-acetyltransferase [Burkholderiaceae bacterium]HQR71557.1 GNAT family N-acetyltransferase [Burkholderiaceae bacterium]